MKHREIYQWLLAPARRAATLTLLAEQGYQTALGYRKSAVIDGPKFAYIRLLIPRSGRMAAHSGGAYVDLSQYPELGQTDLYYLPLVAIVDPKDPIALEHELLHVADLMQWIEEDPTYPVRALRMTSYEPGDDADLEERIHFELSKILRLESRAFQQEYRSGVRSINVPVAAGQRADISCRSEEELVKIWLSQYVGKLAMSFDERFPQHRARVANAMRSGAELYGRDSFEDYDEVLFWQQQLPRLIYSRLLGEQNSPRCSEGGSSALRGFVGQTNSSA